VITDQDIEAAIQHNDLEADHDEKTAKAGGPENVQLLAEALNEHKVMLGFDAVAGPLTGLLLKTMPLKSTLYVYGGLSGKPCSFIRGSDLIFGQKQLRGFWAIAHVRAKREPEQKALAAQIMGQVRKGQSLHTPIKSEFSLDKGIEAISAYLNDMTGGKIVIAPQLGKSATSSAGSGAAPTEKKEETKSDEPAAAPAAST